MFIQRILLLITFISYTQTVKDELPHKLNTETNVKELVKNNSGRTQNPRTESAFEKFLKKFEPGAVWERIDKKIKYEGLEITDEEHLDMMLEGIDPIDEIMDMNIENGNPKLVLGNSRRDGWKSNSAANPHVDDTFYLRQRIYELMKQAIYQTRNRMVIMQQHREALQNSSLYKMGFLTNKIDNQVKVYTAFSLRTVMGCTQRAEKVLLRFPIYDILNANERQTSLLFSVETLVDLLQRNDETCKKIFRKHKQKRVERFDKAFEN